MPELNPQYEQFQKEIEKLLSELLAKIKKANFTDVELAQLSAQIDFYNELRLAGFEEVVNKYFQNYDDELLKILKQAELRGVRRVTGIDNLMAIKQLDQEYLLRGASSWASRWESELFKSIIRGDTIQKTIQNLEGIPLTDAQLGTVLNTAYSDFGRISTKQIYESKPEQRFKYVGGIIPTSSDECRWLVINQKESGYTAKEIEAGIETPFKHKYTDKRGLFKAGDPKIINWDGRNPNFNCIHQWEAV